jgi:hypothetical protein
MIKYTVISSSAPGMDEKKWRQWHVGRHTDLISKFPGLRRLVTWKTIEPGDAKLPPLDDAKRFSYNDPGFTYAVEFYYDSLEAQRKAYVSKEAVAGRADSFDMPGYVVNSKRYSVELVDDRTLKGRPMESTNVKFVVTWNAAADLNEEKWKAWYLGRHSDLVSRFPGLRRFTTWKTVEPEVAKLPRLEDAKHFIYNRPDFDFEVELFYDSLEAQRNAYVSNEAKTNRADGFAQPEGYVINSRRYCAELIDDRTF